MATRRRGAGAVLALLLGLGIMGGLTTGWAGWAQGPSWACPVPATASPVAGSPVASVVEAAETVPFPGAGGDLTIFAAASLTDAFTAIAADLEATHPNLAITFNFAGSQTLVTQLTQGAAADVFASANPDQMAAAIAAGLIAGDPVTFTTNRLVIAVPAGNPAGLATAADLARDGLRLVIAQPEVPAGTYARQAVCLMGRDAGGYGPDFVSRVAANVVSAEEDVRDVLAKVQLGEADAGIVYRSDALGAGADVRLIEMPDALNVVATYPIAPVAGGNPDLGAAFIAHVLGPEGQETLAAHGFGRVP